MASPDRAPGGLRTRLIWLAGLAALALVAVGLVVLLASFRNPLPDLTLPALEAAERRWQQHGPPSYNIDVAVAGARPGTFHVEVRDGEVVTPPTLNGHPIERRHTWHTWTVDGQFDTMDRDLQLAADPEGEMQAQAGTRLILRAQFDPALGYPLRFQRHVLGHGPEVSWEVTRFEAVADDGKRTPVSPK